MSKPLPLVRLVIASLTLVLAGCTLPSGAMAGCNVGEEKGTSVAGLDQVTLCIASGKKVHPFTVEVARSTQQQAQGLMFREELADDAGMIFPFPQPRPASFWMKNTIVSLDLLFIRKDGTIESIAQNAIPYSTDPMTSQGAVAAVLELRGGLTSELGIKAGDKVAWEK